MSLDDLAMLYEHRSQRYSDGNLNSDGTEFYFDEASTAKRQTISVDAKYEKRRVTFARLLSRVSAELSSEVNIDINVYTCSSLSSKSMLPKSVFVSPFVRNFPIRIVYFCIFFQK